MIRLNEHYLKLKSSYLFSDIAKRVEAYQKANPDQKIIKLGIGDVTCPLPQVCINAFHRAVDEMSNDKTFRGYGPEQGYLFLREAIAKNDYLAFNTQVAPDEIFVSDGAKCDTGNVQELFATDIQVAIPDPVYPVYVDTNVMAGRTGHSTGDRYQNLIYMECTNENDFVPELPKEADLIYLCYPNNPTGATITKEQLKHWVDYALTHNALILYDAAYVEFIRDSSLPRSIFEIQNARKIAIEFRSFSKTAGFTGTRCAYTVVPKECMIYDSSGQSYPLHSFWNRRHTTKFNGVSYPVQRAAEAIFSEEGKQQVKALTDYYLRNAALIRKEMTDSGFQCTGGDNSPYIWINTKMDSWQFFDILLNKIGIVCTPGSGFGQCGAGYIRLSAFNHYDQVEEAMKRIKNYFKNHS